MSEERSTQKPSPAARHVAEKIRDAIRVGRTVDVFGRKRLTGVVLDLEMAEAFVRDVDDGTK